jgi:hypothetical protein
MDTFVERPVFTILYYTIPYTTLYQESENKKKTVSLHNATLHYAILMIHYMGDQGSVIGILPYYTTLRDPLPLHYTLAGVGASPMFVTHTLTRWRHGISKSASGSEPNGAS